MRTLNNPFPWLPGDTIAWPTDDKKLHLVNNWVDDLDKVLPLVDGRTVAIQAGGACGIWPARLALEFDQVFTVEPNAENYECLALNCTSFVNIFHERAAFGVMSGRGRLCRDEFEDGNAGAWYLEPGNEFDIIDIDALNLSACDFIALDVEGSELEALTGAIKTIDEYHPVIMLECKQLPHMPIPATAAIKFLISRGYQQIAKFHNDIVMKHD